MKYERAVPIVDMADAYIARMLRDAYIRLVEEDPAEPRNVQNRIIDMDAPVMEAVRRLTKEL